MKQIFNYTEKFIFSYCYPAIAFIAMAVFTGISQRGLRFRNLRLLEYPNSLYISIVCAVIFIVYAYYKYRNAKKSGKSFHSIEVTDTDLTFPDGKSGQITIALININKLYNNSEDGGKQLILYTSDKQRFVFYEDRFDKVTDYAEFTKIIQNSVAVNFK